MDHVIWTILYGPYYMDHIIWTILYGPYCVDHIIWIMSDGPIHMVCSTTAKINAEIVI